jgi:hypothetical protein
MLTLIKYYSEERERILKWLKCLSRDLEPGHFRFCIRGNLATTNGHRGLGLSTYAMKILYQIGGIDSYDSLEMSKWIEFIQSFQVNSNRRNRGYFVDYHTMRQAFKSSILGYLSRLKFWDLVMQNQRFVRAETRQAVSTLLMINSKSLYPISGLPESPNLFISWLEKLPWKTPWVAGSHASHYFFFYWYNGTYFNRPYNWHEIINNGFEYMDSLRQPDGTWHQGNVSAQQKINGAMKILTAYAWCNKHIDKPELLIDLSLYTNSWGDGCSIQNNLFVLQQASKFCSYKQTEVMKKATKVLNGLNEFRKEDGAYSFSSGKSQTTIYGYPVSIGLHESDLHGTMMFTWIISTCLDLLGISREVGWSPQKP